MRVILFLLLFAGSAMAQEINHEEQYQACLGLAQTQPELALSAAQGWAQLGGGVAAGHCEAMALYGQGQAQEAAKILGRLSQQQCHPQEFCPDDPALYKYFATQAADTWMAAREYQKAYVLYRAALVRDPEDVELMSKLAELEMLLEE